MTFEHIIRTLANTNLGLPTLDCITIADALIRAENTSPFATHAGRVQAALADPECRTFMRVNKKIQAIKRLRDLAYAAGCDSENGAGLKACKDAVDTASPMA